MNVCVIHIILNMLYDNALCQCCSNTFSRETRSLDFRIASKSSYRAYLQSDWKISFLQDRSCQNERQKPSIMMRHLHLEQSGSESGSASRFLFTQKMSIKFKFLLNDPVTDEWTVPVQIEKSSKARYEERCHCVTFLDSKKISSWKLPESK